MYLIYISLLFATIILPVVDLVMSVGLRVVLALKEWPWILYQACFRCHFPDQVAYFSNHTPTTLPFSSCEVIYSLHFVLTTAHFNVILWCGLASRSDSKWCRTRLKSCLWNGLFAIFSFVTMHLHLNISCLQYQLAKASFSVKGQLVFAAHLVLSQSFRSK